MEYIIRDFTTDIEHKYAFSYKDLREKYYEFCSLTDKSFLERLPEALHLACFISYIKELGLESTLSDEGIIHELIHLLQFGSYKGSISDKVVGRQGIELITTKRIRKKFKHLLRLD